MTEDNGGKLNSEELRLACGPLSSRIAQRYKLLLKTLAADALPPVRPSALTATRSVLTFARLVSNKERWSRSLADRAGGLAESISRSLHMADSAAEAPSFVWSRPWQRSRAHQAGEPTHYEPPIMPAQPEDVSPPAEIELRHEPQEPEESFAGPAVSYRVPEPEIGPPAGKPPVPTGQTPRSVLTRVADKIRARFFKPPVVSSQESSVGAGKEPSPRVASGEATPGPSEAVAEPSGVEPETLAGIDQLPGVEKTEDTTPADKLPEVTARKPDATPVRSVPAEERRAPERPLRRLISLRKKGASEQGPPSITISEPSMGMFAARKPFLPRTPAAPPSEMLHHREWIKPVAGPAPETATGPEEAQPAPGLQLVQRKESRRAGEAREPGIARPETPVPGADVLVERAGPAARGEELAPLIAAKYDIVSRSSLKGFSPGREEPEGSVPATGIADAIAAKYGPFAPDIPEVPAPQLLKQPGRQVRESPPAGIANLPGQVRLSGPGQEPGAGAGLSRLSPDRPEIVPQESAYISLPAPPAQVHFTGTEREAPEGAYPLEPAGEDDREMPLPETGVPLTFVRHLPVTRIEQAVFRTPAKTQEMSRDIFQKYQPTEYGQAESTGSLPDLDTAAAPAGLMPYSGPVIGEFQGDAPELPDGIGESPVSGLAPVASSIGVPFVQRAVSSPSAPAGSAFTPIETVLAGAGAGYREVSAQGGIEFTAVQRTLETGTQAAGDDSGRQVPDLDEFARQVYVIIRRKLAIERERAGCR
ncbi:MAG: hypothetical protein IBX68_05515 [Dehalococcoidia bacterium]|nr:hypothetical protein [Dehalococcoidia bacterium]